jgi:hypothetical protein
MALHPSLYVRCPVCITLDDHLVVTHEDRHSP